ncbi:MAG: branched-chain-amino-acid transaminase [Spirochaetaceae bacterium]|nr:MAG: branched-chain-amino-acid transaminase [Spirochaetaceae bacterium]
MIYIDGKIYGKEDAKISVFDHGLLYGDGVFEGIRIYHGRIFRLKAHLDRLYNSAQAIRLSIPMEKDKLGQIMQDMVDNEKKKDGYIRLVVTRGVGDLGINPYLCKKASIIIIVDNIQLFPPEYYTKGVRLKTSSLRRVGVDTFDPRIKSLNYLNNILAKIEALDAGCLEAVILNKEGYVTECTGDNIFFVHNGKIMTPPCYIGALEGITRGAVLELCLKTGMPVEERNSTLYDLYTADECFLTGSGAELVPVIEIDGRTIGNGAPGKITASITKAFNRLVEQEAKVCQ